MILTRRELLKGLVVVGAALALPLAPARATQLYWSTLTESEWGAMTEDEWSAMLEAPVPTGTTLTGTTTIQGAVQLR